LPLDIQVKGGSQPGLGIEFRSIRLTHIGRNVAAAADDLLCDAITRLAVPCYGPRKSLADLLFSLPSPRLNLLRFIRLTSLPCNESTTPRVFSV
jgi:hypothetical protein